MSKYNKVNPGIYTQRGRLTPDEAARERRKQSATSPDRTSQPMSIQARPAPAPPSGGGGAVRAAAPADASAKAPKTERTAATKSKSVPGTPAAGARRAGTSKARSAKTTATKKTAATKRAASAPNRKAVLARNAGGPGASPRRSTKRRTR